GYLTMGSELTNTLRLKPGCVAEASPTKVHLQGYASELGLGDSMIEIADSRENIARENWAAWLQRRLIRLLLQHDQGLFRRQFRMFFVESEQPQHPLLQQYDRYIRLLALSDELLDDILPRIRRQLSLQSDHARL